MARKFQPLSRDEVESIAANATKEAVSFITTSISPARIKAHRYFLGEVDLDSEEGRSTIVMTKCRDAVRQVKASLQRVFAYSDRPVEFIPGTPADGPGVEQATRYITWKFLENNGFRILNDMIQDSLVKKMGFTKTYWVERSKRTIHDYEDLDEDQLAVILSEPDIEVLEYGAEPAEPDPNVPGKPELDPLTGQPVMDPETGAPAERMPLRFNLKIARGYDKGEMVNVSVPPEEIIVNKEARSIDDFYLIGHRTEERIGDLIRRGFKLDDLVDLDTFNDAEIEDEDNARRPDEDQARPRNDENLIDLASKLVGIAEVYMELDVEGTGVPILHKIILGGSAYKLLDYAPIDEVPFSCWEIDPEPHAFFGRSLVEIIIEDQDLCTSIMRGIVDNVHMVNNPRHGVLEDHVNMDDMLNGEIAGVVRMDRPDAVIPLTVPFVAGDTLAALQYVDANVDNKTGVSRASMGLDPDALQSTTRAAVSATIQAAAAQVEVMARNLAETGMKQMFRKMLRLYVKHVKEELMMRLNDSWVPVDPRTWNASMDARPNVGLGTGREEERAMALDALLMKQEQIIQTQGPDNGLVTLTQYRNAIADRLLISGIRNADRYYQPMTPEAEQALIAKYQEAQAAAAQAAGGAPAPDPTAGLVQAEQVKAQVKMLADQQAASLKQQQMVMDDDLKRDQMAQDLAIEIGKIMAQYGVKIDTARLQAEQQAMRPPQAALMAGAQAPPPGPQGGPMQ